MKKKFILVPLVGLLLFVVLSGYEYGPGTVGYERTGASGSGTGCGGPSCHTSASSSTSGIVLSLQLIDASTSTSVTTYTPGHSYYIVVGGTNSSSFSGLDHFGFQVAVVKSSGAGSASFVNAGTLAVTGISSVAHTTSPSGVNIVEHGPNAIGGSPYVSGSGGSGTTYSISVPWTAPSAGTGTVVIYEVLNAVNHDGSSSNDYWNNTTANILEGVGTISGTTSVCPTATTTLNCTPSGGTWSTSAGTGSVTVSSSGVVTGSTTGTATVTYNAGASGTATTTVTVKAAPGAIAGSLSICQGASTGLTDPAGLGTWTSATTSVATVNLITGSMAGVVTGATTPATSAITFTAASTGCTTTSTATINPLPSAITGTTSLCQGATTTLSNASPGSGTWSSATTGVATIGSSSGVVSAVATGSTSPATTVITFTNTSGCSTTTTVTVNPLPSAITGSTNVCPGATTSLSDPTGTGTWTSSSPTIASVVSGTGLVSGIAPSGGSAVITYSVTATGCTTSTTVNVSPAPGTISGILSVCAGSTTLLSDGGGGTWTSGSTGIATIGTAGLVTGVAPSGGTSVITYALPATGCTTTAILTVNPTPSSITGIFSVCPGAVTTLGDGTSGGSWSSGSGAIATVDGSGNVTGVSTSGGTSVITYAVSGCSVTATVNVNPSPGTISGPNHVCVGSDITLTDGGGGTWSFTGSAVSVAPGTTGTVSGISAGTAAITYTLPVTGCFTSTPVTVNPLPLAGSVSGTMVLCVTAAVTLSDGIGGGIWSSALPGIATVGSTGHVIGLANGTDTISYSVTNGCGTAVATAVVTINPLPISGTLSGPSSVCVGSTISLTSSGSPGVWTSSSTGFATVGSASGTVSGASSGTTNISYTVTNSCGVSIASKQVTVNALPTVITASATHVCVGSTITLTDAGGGTWVSSDASLASLGSSGSPITVTGIGSGTPIVTYSLASGCSRSIPLTVNATPGAISGAAALCQGSTISLSDTSAGGTWSVTGTSATVASSTGVVTGAGSGISTIKYTFPASGCATSAVVTVNPIVPISGLSSLCAGLTTTLSDATTGGGWVSSNTAVATIGSLSGFVNAVGPGSAVITYTTLAGCTATTTMNVISSPTAISGTPSVCQGSTTALIDAGGGIWSSSATANATVGSTGIVTGVSAGATFSTATISYSLGTGCTVSVIVTVNPLPSAIAGAVTHVCPGGSISFTDPSPSGTWIVVNPNATIGTTGSVSGVTAGLDTIYYALATGCSVSKAITVNAIPAAIGGTLSLCQGATTSLTDGSGTGTWASGTTSAATVSSAGLVSGVSSGITSPVTSTITFTLGATGCTATAVVTVNPLPSAISGSALVCPGATTTLTDVITGGTWSSSSVGSGSVSVSTTGDVTGVSTGTSIITYTLGTGCKVTKTVTINGLPPAIGGSGNICGTGTTSLIDGTPGGTWFISPASSAVATVSTTGVVTGAGLGTATVSYTLPTTGCTTMLVVTVNPLPSAITGTTNVCVGSTITLSDGGLGTWTSGAPAIATVGSGSGVVTGVSAALPTATITYTLPTGCKTTMVVSINALPPAIGGSAGVCIGSSTSLIESGSGIWDASNTNATVGPTGSVTGAIAGMDTISFTSASGCMITKTVTVHAAPAAITGTLAVCQGATTSLLDGAGAGTWGSSATGVATVSATGVVSGVTSAATVPATAIIGFTLTSTGCSTTTEVTVNPLPSPITGVTHVCPGTTATLVDGGGGTWSTASTLITVGSSSGTVTGVSAGLASVDYTLITGCGTSIVVTINALPTAGTVTGGSSVCAGAHTTLTDAGTGTWSSSNISVATIGTTGIVAGVAAGVDTLAYTVTNICGSAIAIHVVTVNPNPVAGTITGPSTICMGPTGITLTDASAGGAWSSSNSGIATIGSGTGVVSGVAPGFVTFTYSVTNLCGTATTTATDTVYPAAAVDSIVGADTVCQGATIALTDPSGTGVWSSSSANATVDATGVVTGVSAGSATISYSVTTICGTATAQLSLYVKSTAECNTGVSELPALGETIKVYPNPSQGTFTVQLPATTNGSVITIMDVTGRVIETRNIAATNSQNVVFELRNVAAGSYLIRVNADNNTFRDKIVIW